MKAPIRQLLTTWGDWVAEGVEGRIKSPLNRIGEIRGAPSGLPGGLWEPRDVTVARRILAALVDESRAGTRYRDALIARYVRHENPDPNLINRAEKKAADIWVRLLSGRYN